MNQNTVLSQDPILTVKEVSQYLRMSKSKIYYLISQKKFPHFRIQKNVRVRQSALMKWLEEKTERVQ